MIQQTKFFLTVLAIAVLFSACATVPMTERRQLAFIPRSELQAMSLTSYREVLGGSKLSQDTVQVARIRGIGSRLATAAESYLRSQGHSTSEYAWEFNLIDDSETINAWCMPGGKVAVYTGILPVAQNDNGLAVVMGHEIAHALANHGNERMSQSLLLELGGVALSTALKQQPAKTKELFMTSYGAAGQVGLLLPYSRLHEKEADRIGLILMAMAGYDPREAIPFWQRMNAQGGGRPPEFLSTHPAPESRIAQIEQLLPEAMAIFEGKK